MSGPRDTRRRLLFAVSPVAALLLLAECGARLAGAPACEPIVPDASGWDTMVGDPELLWKLEADREFQGPGGVTRINAVGCEPPCCPTHHARPGRGRHRRLQRLWLGPARWILLR